MSGLTSDVWIGLGCASDAWTAIDFMELFWMLGFKLDASIAWTYRLATAAAQAMAAGINAAAVPGVSSWDPGKLGAHWDPVLICVCFEVHHTVRSP